MNIIEQVENVKDKVKTHSIVPFNVSDITVEQHEGRSPILHNNDRFSIRGRAIKSFLGSVGLKDSCGSRSFDEPETKWGSLRSALDRVGHAPDLAAVVNEDGREVIDIIKDPIREERGLNYDARIDAVMDAIEDSDQEFHEIRWDGFGVRLSTKDTKNEIDCGAGDLWQHGININLGHNRQEFSAFYLRLICTNGMVTQENYARRKVSANNIGNQFINFVARNDFGKTVRDRVNKMRSCKASVAEVNEIAGALTEQERRACPELGFYEGLVQTYGKHGYDIHKMPKEQARRAFTNENLYDIFNVGTALATHNRTDLGESKVRRLNKACGDIFKKGPDLETAVINPYNN
jgi:hypothetical protein